MDGTSAAFLVKHEMIALGYTFFEDGLYDLNLVGLRSAQNRSNLFDDTFLAIFQDESGWRCESWPCTTDPGRPHLERPLRAEGCAILVPGQYRGMWTIGRHKGDQPALVQSAPVKVWRDNNKDAIADYGGPVHEGQFGINLHRAGTNSPVIGEWSAGCQVLKRSADLETLLGYCRRQAARGPGWDRFSYTLFHLAQSPGLGALALTA